MGTATTANATKAAQPYVATIARPIATLSAETAPPTATTMPTTASKNASTTHGPAFAEADCRIDVKGRLRVWECPALCIGHMCVRVGLLRSALYGRIPESDPLQAAIRQSAHRDQASDRSRRFGGYRYLFGCATRDYTNQLHLIMHIITTHAEYHSDN